jgi:indole-3-glycerol phosphate synthase
MRFLEEIIEATRRVVAERKRQLSLESLRATTSPRPDNRAFRDALAKSEMSIIAEFKRCSPSNGMLQEAADLRKIVSAYERGGARALSVLTEESRFCGSLEDLRVARTICELPILRKDFIIEEYQLYEAVEAGADAVLLIVAALERSTLRRLHDLARELHLDVLVEIRSSEELEQALEIDADIIGINNRRLQVPSEVDIETTYQLVEPLLKNGHITIVSESGIKTRDELEALASAGVDAALIGTTLMQSSDPEAMCSELAHPARQSRASKTSGQPVPA